MISHTYHQHEAAVDAYIAGVLDETIPAGRLVRLAVQRHVQDMAEGEKRGLHFDRTRAGDACAFFATLKHSKGEWAGKPFVLSPSQLFITWCLFGWQCGEYRRFSRAHIEVARKWGKSEYASGLALKLATMDFPLEPGAEVLLCATKEDQVRDTTFKQCCRMVERAPLLAKRLEVSKKSIYVPPTDRFQPHSVLKPVGSDSATSDGFDTSAAVLDELHAWKKHHHEHYDKMTTAGGSRRQELVLIFTTAGNDESELWITLREQAVRAVESVETKDYTADHIFAFVACIDEDDDPLSHDLDSEEFEKIMAKANPNYPVTPKWRYLRQQAAEAQSNPLARNKFNRFHANIRVSSSIQPFSQSKWQELSRKWDNIEDGKGGFDVGRTDDFAAWSVVWREGGLLRITSRSYTCADRRQELQTTLVEKFIDAGQLIEHPGNQVDFNAFREDIISFANAHDVYGWAYDPHNATVMAQQIQDELGAESVVKFVQSQRYYNEPCNLFLKEFTADEPTICPEVNECLAWQFRNVAYVPNPRGEVMPNKGLSQEYKIDGAVATLMAYGLLMLEPDQQCVYSEPGNLAL